VWVLFKTERQVTKFFVHLHSIPRIRYFVRSKAAWQKGIHWERNKGPTVQALHGLTYTFLAESEDKESLEQMKALIEGKDDG
jgi:hypothetical protein